MEVAVLEMLPCKADGRFRDNGYVLTIDGLRIYIAGDTEDIPEMSALKGIDIALFGSGTVSKELLMRFLKTFHKQRKEPPR